MDMKKIIYMLIGVAVACLQLSCTKNAATWIEDPSYKIQSDESLFAVYPIAVSVPAEGGEVEFTITGNENWTIEVGDVNTSKTDWCVLDKVSGNGKTTVKATVTQSNSFVKNRSMEFLVSNGKKTLKTKVVQGLLTLADDEVLINGLIWINRNVGKPGTFTDEIDDIGYCYQFNRKEGWVGGKANPDFVAAVNSYVPSEGDDWVTSAWTDANNPCPTGWRVPTGQEVCDLLGDSEANLKAVSVNASATNGFKVRGYIVGVDKSVAATLTKENVTSSGALFIPQSGWLNEYGNWDRDWLVVLRTATSLNKSMGGMFLSSWGYTDAWGWGDGQKVRAAPVRCVKILEIED